MNRFIFVLVLLLLCATSLWAAPLKVVAWNLEWFPGRKPKADAAAKADHMKAAQTALEKIRPDILLLGEVANADAVEKVTSVLPGFNVHVVSRFKQGFAVGKQQTAIASRFIADTTFAEEWKASAHLPPRGFSFAAIELPDHVVLLTYAVHLKSNRGANDPAENSENIAKREEAARQLVDHVSAMEKQYQDKGRKVAVLIGGDFNLLETPEFSGETTRQILIDAGFNWAWHDVPFAERITWPPQGNYGGACFDHYFSKGLGSVKSAVLNIEGVSDHHPIELLIDLK